MIQQNSTFRITYPSGETETERHGAAQHLQRESVSLPHTLSHTPWLHTQIGKHTQTTLEADSCLTGLVWARGSEGGSRWEASRVYFQNYPLWRCTFLYCFHFSWASNSHYSCDFEISDYKDINKQIFMTMGHGRVAVTLSKKTRCRIIRSVPIFVENKQYIFLKRKSSEKV